MHNLFLAIQKTLKPFANIIRTIEWHLKNFI